jgi:hypothetical protein
VLLDVLTRPPVNGYVEEWDIDGEKEVAMGRDRR